MSHPTAAATPDLVELRRQQANIDRAEERLLEANLAARAVVADLRSGNHPLGLANNISACACDDCAPSTSMFTRGLASAVAGLYLCIGGLRAMRDERQAEIDAIEFAAELAKADAAETVLMGEATEQAEPGNGQPPLADMHAAC